MSISKSAVLSALFLTIVGIEIALTWQYYWVAGWAARAFLLVPYTFVILFSLTLLAGGYRRAGWGAFFGFFILMLVWQLPGFWQLRRLQRDMDGFQRAAMAFVEKNGRAPRTLEESGYEFRYPETRKKIQYYEANGRDFGVGYQAPHPSVSYFLSSKRGLYFQDD